MFLSYQRTHDKLPEVCSKFATGLEFRGVMLALQYVTGTPLYGTPSHVLVAVNESTKGEPAVFFMHCLSVI